MIAFLSYLLTATAGAASAFGWAYRARLLPAALDAARRLVQQVPDSHLPQVLKHRHGHHSRTHLRRGTAA